MVAGLWVTFAIAIVFLFLVEKTFGWQFFNAANMNYWGAVYGSKAAPTIPVWGLILMLVPSLVVSALYTYTSEFKTFVLDAVLVPAVTFFGTLIAGMILPWRKRFPRNDPTASHPSRTRRISDGIDGQPEACGSCQA